MPIWSVNIRDKGQMTLPADLREELGLRKGDRLLVERRGKQIIMISPEDVVDPTAGALAEYARNLPEMTQAEMHDASARAVATENLETLRQIESDRAGR